MENSFGKLIGKRYTETLEYFAFLDCLEGGKYGIWRQGISKKKTGVTNQNPLCTEVKP